MCGYVVKIREMDVNQYIQLLEKRDDDLTRHERLIESFIQLKEYNTNLRIAIVNIPQETAKNTTQVAQAIKKAKRLASKEPEIETPEKKRKSVFEDTTPRVKRPYKKRKALAITSNTIEKDEEDKPLQSSNHNEESSDKASDISSSSSSSSHGEEMCIQKTVVSDRFM